MIRSEDGTPLGSIDVNALDDKERKRLGLGEPDEVQPTQQAVTTPEAARELEGSTVESGGVTEEASKEASKDEHPSRRKSS